MVIIHIFNKNKQISLNRLLFIIKSNRLSIKAVLKLCKNNIFTLFIDLLSINSQKSFKNKFKYRV